MGLFNFFKKQVKQDRLLIQGPKYLRNNLTTPTPDLIDTIKIQPAIEWMGQLISSTQNRFFKIRYYGDLLDNETIVSEDDNPQRVIAIDVDTNEEILVFDKALHGWDGFIIDGYKDQKNIPRPADKLYQTKNGADRFRIIFVAVYNSGTEQELLELKASENQMELENGLTLNIQDAFDDAFDWVVIYAIDDNGNRFELINEELA
jgi:hypothetical protein